MVLNNISLGLRVFQRWVRTFDIPSPFKKPILLIILLLSSIRTLFGAGVSKSKCRLLQPIQSVNDILALYEKDMDPLAEAFDDDDNSIDEDDRMEEQEESVGDETENLLNDDDDDDMEEDECRVCRGPAEEGYVPLILANNLSCSL